MSSKFLDYAVVGAVCLAVGFFSGIGFTALNRGTYGELEDQIAKERDEHAASIEEVEETWRSILSGKENAFRDSEVKLKKKALLYESYWAKSQVLLGMTVNTPGTHALISHQEFWQKFKPDWFDPKKFDEIMGREWFMRELIRWEIGDIESYGNRLHYDFAREQKKEARRLIDPEDYFRGNYVDFLRGQAE